MKYFLMTWLVVLSSIIMAQPFYTTCTGDAYWSFDISEYDSSWYYIQLDTAAENTWQFGQAQKSMFVTSPGDRVLITDSVQPYPISNISIFEVYFVIDCDAFGRTESYWGTEFQIIFSMQSTEGSDGGKIDISHSGSPWVNIINDPEVDDIGFGEGILYTIDDSVAALHEPGFSRDLTSSLHLWFDESITNDEYDTIGLRFTFASDSLIDSLDGWMFESIFPIPAYEGINTGSMDQMISLYPNPASEYINLFDNIRLNGNMTYQVFNEIGQILFRNNGPLPEQIDISSYANGIYFLNYLNDKISGTIPFIVNK